MNFAKENLNYKRGDDRYSARETETAGYGKKERNVSCLDVATCDYCIINDETGKTTDYSGGVREKERERGRKKENEKYSRTERIFVKRL